MKLLYGTGNPAKLSAMKKRLETLGIDLIGLQDLKAEGRAIPKVSEDGNTPLENARQKAEAYYKAFRMPVFSCDSGLYFENVPEEEQPGVHVRNVKGKCLSDEEMIEYYGGMAKRYGRLTAKYKNAICFILDEDHIYEAMEPSMESERFLLTDVAHSAIRKEGFPLDSISIDIKTNQYYYDLPENRLEQVAVEDGFLLFFQRVLGNQGEAETKSEEKPEANSEEKPEANSEEKPEANSEEKPEAKSEVKAETKSKAKPEANSEVKYEENCLDYRTYHSLRESVGWKNFAEAQAREALENSCYSLVAFAGRQPVGMARMVGDGLYYLIADVVVSPEYQGKGIGKELMQRLIGFVKERTQEGGRASIQLISDLGKEGFYEKMGFKRLPNEYCGYGMRKVIQRKTSAGIN